MPNRLINETSPYLLQHAHNPVEWYPWGDEALSAAKKENKPILVSIGYSSCHWCHVMERESFEDEAIGDLMNKNFINIKVDREERPDLDHIYMDAVQAMTGGGGWPLNVFLTPDGKPFYGGTYFPPKAAFNRPSWKDTLVAVKQAFLEKRDEVDTQAENLTQHLFQSNTFGMHGAKTGDLYGAERREETFSNIMATADLQWGGFGKAPKFPQPFSITWLLRYSWLSSLQSNSSNTQFVENGKSALKQALLSLDKMIDGGIYDQLGGGFARYATDAEWLVPHFEKMLYDNALLLGVISEAYQLTHDEKYLRVINETIGFLEREMKDTNGGFYAALDADSEGEEGKFYVWEYDEVLSILGEDGEIFAKFFDITPNGNFSEGGKRRNILWRKKTVSDFSKEQNITVESLLDILEKGKKKLFEKRSKRTRPQLDDKILLGWNALLNTALSKAFAATGEESYKQLAIVNMDFLLKNLSVPGKIEFYHTWKNNVGRYPAFLDDYTYLVQALIMLQEITGDTTYMEKARELTTYVIENFSEPETGFFFYTGKDQPDIIVRKKEVFDGAQPSGNALMMDNLFRLGIYYDLPYWKERAIETTKNLGEAISKYPTSFGVWAGFVLEVGSGINEIAIIGKDPWELLKGVLGLYIPHKIVMCTDRENKDFPMLKDKKMSDQALIYLCREYTCKKPVSGLNELLEVAGAK